MIREITADDIPWVLSLFHQRYPDFDPGGALKGLAIGIQSATTLALRSEHGFCGANIVASLWYPQKRDCHILVLCVEEGQYHWEAVKLLRSSICWAREQGCKRWWFTSDTEHAIAALADRVGARVEPHYLIEL